MELSRRYWQQCGLPGLTEQFPHLTGLVAAGLVGEGSEVYGYDDALSRDHDWGVGFCLWLPRALYREHGAALAAWYNSLPAEFEGVPKKLLPERVGVLESTAFFEHFIGTLPKTNLDWLRIPESSLAVCTNGEIFYDPTGEVTRLHHALATPPASVVQKKLAARCVTMMQAGQYNLPRCHARGEKSAAALATHEFVQAAAGAAFLLCGRWPPFYKWLPRALRELPGPGAQLSPLLNELLCPPPSFPGLGEDPNKRQALLVRECCTLVANELRRQGLVSLHGCDMQQLGLEIQSRIADETLRSLPVLAG